MSNVRKQIRKTLLKTWVCDRILVRFCPHLAWALNAFGVFEQKSNLSGYSTQADSVSLPSNKIIFFSNHETISSGNFLSYFFPKEIPVCLKFDQNRFNFLKWKKI